jgi:hypothetical protein
MRRFTGTGRKNSKDKHIGNERIRQEKGQQKTGKTGRQESGFVDVAM